MNGGNRKQNDSTDRNDLTAEMKNKKSRVSI